MSEYACQVFHNGLPEYLSEELEKIQRRALRIIFPDLGYQEESKSAILPPSINGANGWQSAYSMRLRRTASTNYMAFCRHVILVL